LAITTVAGNVAVQQSTRNALYTAELCGSDVPVFMGAEEPLNRPHQSAHWFHGRMAWEIMAIRPRADRTKNCPLLRRLSP